MSDNILLKSVQGASSIQLEQFAGSDCTESDGAANRVLTTAGVSGASGEIIVIADKQTLRKTDDYTISGNDITFIVRVFDSQKIDIHYIG